MRLQVIQYYCQTILEIIEEKPNFTIPIQIYQLIIFVFFLQLQGYCLTNYESRQLNDEKMESISHLNEIASLTFLIYQKGSDLMTIGFFVAVQIAVYSYFLYVALLSFLMNKRRYIYKRYQSIFKNVNQVLNTYFTLYDWIFFIPIMEINFGMIYCGKKSFLIGMRVNGCSAPIQYKIFGYIGVILGLITSTITSFFFRNYEFDEQNKLKRKFNNFICTTQMILKCSLSLVYYIDSVYTDPLKYSITIILSVICLSDSVWNVPFRDKSILRFYSICASYYFCIAIISSMWIFNSIQIDGSELFYYIILFGIVCQAFVLVSSQYRYNSIIKGNYSQKNIGASPLFGQIDILLEQITKLTQECSHNEESKCQLIEILKLHQQNCIDKTCVCKQSERSYIVRRVRVDFTYFYDLINSIFVWSLQQKEIVKDRQQNEHLMLKYISFLYKYFGNSPRAYFELKLYLSKRSGSSSYYFIMISKVISHSVENQIDFRKTGSSEMFTGLNKPSSMSQRNQELTVYTLLTIDSICERFIPIIINCLQWKILFWEKLLLGYNSMDEIQDHSLVLMHKIEKLSTQFHFKMKQINDFVQQFDSYQLKKLRMMFYLFVLNDTLKAQRLEEEGEELKNRDMLKSHEFIHTTNIMKANVQTLVISLSKNIGKIVSKKDKKFLEFFGYEKEEVEQVRRVNDIMPIYISNLHDQFLKHYVKRGSSSLVQNNFSSFILLKSGYIQQAKIYIDYIFGSEDDYQMAGTILKINSAYDYLVFNRQGIIVGITENVLTKIFSQTKKVPSPNSICNKYFTFLFFQEILKTFRAKREEILNIIENGDYNAQLDMSKKGFFSLNESYDDNFTQLLNYIDYCKRNPKEMKSKVDFDKLDLLDEESLDFLDQFQAFKLLSKTLKKPSSSTNLSNLSSRALRNKILWSNESKSLKIFSIRLFFKYTLHMTQFDLNRQGGMKKGQVFILKFHDITLNKKEVGQKMKFTKSMITYLGATTSIGQLSQFGTQVSSKFPTLTLNNSNEHFTNFKNADTNTSFSKFKDIPMKMITSLVKMKSNLSLHSQKNEQKEQPQVNKRPSLKDLTHKIVAQVKSNHQKQQNPQNQQKEQKNKSKVIQQNIFRRIIGTEHNIQDIDDQSQDDTHSDKNKDDDEDDASSIDGEDEQNLKRKEKQVVEMLKQVNVHEEYHNSLTKHQTDKILNKFMMNENYIKTVDPNHQIKKILQSNTRASKFSIALENAILEAQIELMQEKKQFETVKSLLSSKDQSNLQIDSQNQILLRNDSQNNFLPRRIHSESSNSFLKQEDSQKGSIFALQQNSISSNNKNIPFYDITVQEFVKQPSIQGQETPSIFHNISQDLSPVIKQTNKVKTAPSKKSQFVQNYSQYLSQDSMIKSLIQDQDSQIMDDISQKPVFQNPDEMAYTFRDSQHRVDTPSLEKIEDDSDISSLERKDRMSSKKTLKNMVNKQIDSKYQDQMNESKDQELEENSNLNFKLQKSLEQEEDMDGQLEEIKTQKQKRQNVKKNIRSLYQQSHKSSKTKTHKAMSQHKMQIDMLKKKGMIKNEGNANLFEGSVNSTSSSTKTRYGGLFLREIVSSKRIPIAARQYSFLLVLFFVAFIVLNVLNLTIIQSSMTAFRNYITIIRVPRQLQRQYSIAFIGEYTKYQLKTGYLVDTPDQLYLKLAETYKKSAFTAYNAQYTNNSQIVSESWETIQNSDFYQEKYMIYQDQFPQVEYIRLNMIYQKILTKILLLQKDQTTIQQRDSFLFLRNNYLTFMNDVVLQVKDLVNNVESTVDSLTSQIALTTLSAIISITIIGLLFFPYIYQINQYQEQILMIVSRIYKEQAEIERNKYQVVKQLIDFERWDWLKYNYNGIIWMKFDQFDLKHINQKLKLNSEKKNGSQTKRSLNLQSLIFNQKLNIFKRIWKLQLIVIMSIAYFSFVIIYIYAQNSVLKFPVIKNFNTFNTHISFNNIKVCSQIVGFDRYLAQGWTNYDISDIQDFKNCLNDNMDRLNSYMEINKSVIYDDSNQLPALNRNIGKNLFEGNICAIVVANPCKPNDPTDSLGLSQIYSIVQKCIISFPAVFNYTIGDTLRDDIIKNYLNDDCSKLYTVQSFTRQDETIHLFSSNINASITTISDDISNFLSQYLTIAGVILSIIIGLFIIANWILLRQKLLSMNLLLTLIPEEKLSEEIILNMLKKLRYQ